ncbi:SDR family NAD(P)-dependent oxidoreductase [Williamsia sterculiae]|nr:SDR family NAD(P)-dependent oxidoreductase [Williamsia sterculiae]
MPLRRARPDTDGTLVVFGGRSEIGLEVALRLAAGRVVVLAARRPDDLAGERVRLLEAGAVTVHAVEFDADDLDTHSALIARLVADHGRIGVAVVAFGILGDQARAETDVTHALQIAHTDYLAQISVLTPLASTMRIQQSGAIIVFSSIAGMRVRRANYVYGSTKAGLDGFATGLTDALRGSGVQLLLARPGFVIGTMTRDLMDSGVSPAPLSSTASQVADAVVSALRAGRTVVWIPHTLRAASFVMRLVPQVLWRRMPR